MNTQGTNTKVWMQRMLWGIFILMLLTSCWGGKGDDVPVMTVEEVQKFFCDGGVTNANLIVQTDLAPKEAGFNTLRSNAMATDATLVIPEMNVVIHVSTFISPMCLQATGLLNELSQLKVAYPDADISSIQVRSDELYNQFNVYVATYSQNVDHASSAVVIYTKAVAITEKSNEQIKLIAECRDFLVKGKWDDSNALCTEGVNWVATPTSTPKPTKMPTFTPTVLSSTLVPSTQSLTPSP